MGSCSSRHALRLSYKSGKRDFFDFMSLRNKTLIVTSITFILLLFVMYFLSKAIVLESFFKLETVETRQDVQRVLNLFDDTLKTIDSPLKDWAYWNDTCDFVASINTKKYIQENLLDTTFINLDINFIAFFDKSDKIVYGQFYDVEKKCALPFSPSFKSLISGNRLLFNHKNRESRVAGIVYLSEAPAFIVSRPVLPADEQGTPRGTLIFGRYLDDIEVQELSEIVNLNMIVHSVYEKSLPDDFITASNMCLKSDIFVNPLDVNTIAGYTIIKDIYGKPCLILKVLGDRKIYKYGQITVFYFIIFIIITGVLFSVLLIIMLQKVILFRLSHLEESVMSIRESKNLSLRVPVEGNDELANISVTVNKMLDSLEQSQAELKERTVKLEEANRELRKLDELKSSFISTVSHELRTPLTSIVGFSKIIKKKLKKIFSGALTGEQLEKSKEQIDVNLDIISSEGERLTSIINNILDMARLKSGNMELKKELCSIYSIIDQIGHSISPLLEDRELEFIKDIQEGLPEIMMDKYTIIQVLINLISNAIKFTDKGSIICRVKRNNSEIIFSIIDTGIGIERDHHASIFDEFKQVVNGLTNKPGGTGLGLAICKKIVEQSGGRIWVESEPGKGSNFSFTIPVD